MSMENPGEERAGKRLLVFDATAFYSGIPFSIAPGYTTPEVLAEVRHGKTREAVVEGIIEAGRLKVESPSQSTIKEVRKVAEGSGDIGNLSETDLSLLALAFELKEGGKPVAVVSEDYSLLNVAEALGLKHYTSSKTVFKHFTWVWYCPGCGKAFRSRAEYTCDVCGSRLKRKPSKRRVEHSYTTPAEPNLP